MAKLDLTRDSLDSLSARVQNIVQEDQRRWGTMGPEKLIRHLTHVLQVSLGEVTSDKLPFPVPVFLRGPMRVIFFDWFTHWPHNTFKAPDSFFPEACGDLAEAQEACVAAMNRFVDQLEDNPAKTGFSPLLGDITLTLWARVHGVHMDHHLRQYGV